MLSSFNQLGHEAQTAEECPLQNYSEVLVLYTGGTIGMIRSSNGVYVPKSNLMEKKVKQYPQLHDAAFAAKHSKKFPNFLFLPDTGDGKRVIYTIREYDKLLDSSNMTIKDWIRIAMDVNDTYEEFNGFIVLHGTDTMAYTASALSFMFENLGKTVIITGSQIPLYEARSDGRDNLLNSLVIAGNYCIPEVTIMCHNALFRGNRTTKISSCNLKAFDSPNLQPLANMGTKIQVEWRNIFYTSNIEKFRVHTTLNQNVGLLRLFPSITNEAIRAFLSPPIEGAVLQTYGAGNAPSERPEFLDELKQANDRGVIIVNCTQCPIGQVDPSYETGNALVEAGVIPGSDMTPEAALSKLSYVLGKEEWSLETKRTMMKMNLRGELTAYSKVRLDDLDAVVSVMKALQLSSSDEVDNLRHVYSPEILCKLVSKGNLEKLEIMNHFGAYLSASDYEYRTPLHIACAEGYVEIVKYLLKHGASVHMQDRERRTPLLEAVQNDHHEIIKLIVNAGGYLKLPPHMLGDMLCSAAKYNNLRRLESFALAGADMNELDINNRSALHYAAELNHVDVCLFLLEHGIKINLRDMYGNTACDIAKLLKHDAIVNILEGTDICEKVVT